MLGKELAQILSVALRQTGKRAEADQRGVWYSFKSRLAPFRDVGFGGTYN